MKQKPKVSVKASAILKAQGHGWQTGFGSGKSVDASSCGSSSVFYHHYFLGPVF